MRHWLLSISRELVVNPACHVQVTIREGAPVAGKSIKDARFRTLFDAAVVDIRRQFRHVPGPIGEAVLTPGDELMLDTGAKFATAADTLENFEDVRPLKAPVKQFMMALEVVKVRPRHSYSSADPLAGRRLSKAPHTVSSLIFVWVSYAHVALFTRCLESVIVRT